MQRSQNVTPNWTRKAVGTREKMEKMEKHDPMAGIGDRGPPVPSSHVPALWAKAVLARFQLRLGFWRLHTVVNANDHHTPGRKETSVEFGGTSSPSVLSGPFIHRIRIPPPGRVSEILYVPNNYSKYQYCKQ
jgi:hypothetical protein